MKNQHLILAVAGVALLATACEKKISSDKDKLSYTIGTQFARNLKQQNINIDGAALGRAVNDVMAGKKAILTDEEMQKAMMQMNEYAPKGNGKRSRDQSEEISGVPRRE